MEHSQKKTYLPLAAPEKRV